MDRDVARAKLSGAGRPGAALARNDDIKRQITDDARFGAPRHGGMRRTRSPRPRAPTRCARAARRSTRRSPPPSALGVALSAHVRHRRRRVLADLRRRRAQGVVPRRRRPRGAERDARALLRPERDPVPRPRAGDADHARRGRELLRRARALRQAAARALPAGRDPLRARRLSGHRAARALDRPRRRRSCAGCRLGGAVSLAARHRAEKPAPGATRWKRSPRRAAPASTRATVAKELAELGGFFTERDLAAQEAHWGEPIRGSYRGVTIYETPAPTQGFTVLEMLNLLEPFELAQARVPRPRPRAPAGAGEADRLPRPRPLARRSALRRRADGEADLESRMRTSAGA